jgi:hypothetical protein
MNLIVLAFASIVGIAIHADLVLDRASLEQENGGQFFDAHNHIDKILPPPALVNPEKYIYGEPLSLDDLKNFWTSLSNSDTLLDTKNAATRNLLTCNSPLKFCSKLINNSMCEEKLRKGLAHVFSLSAFNNSVTLDGLRQTLFELPGLSSASDTLKAQALLFELAKTKVDLVELTRPLTSNHQHLENLINDLNAQTPSAANLRFSKRLKELNLEVPRVKWLLSLDSTQLGEVDSRHTSNYSDGQCTISPIAAKDQSKSDLYNVLLKNNDVVGIEIGGPETSCITSTGAVKFMKLAETAYFAAKDRQGEDKLVVHAHVGEGVPVTTQRVARNDVEACNAAENFPPVVHVFDRNQEVPVHVIEAQKNIAYILTAIQELKKLYDDLDDHVVFRLTHLTHLTDSLAKQAKALGVSADVSLSSNVASGALAIDSKILDKYITQKNETAESASPLLATLTKNGATVGEIFENHGLKWLLKHHVPVTLASDGSGVSHVDNLRGEYLIAKELIDHWNATDAAFKAAGVTIDEVLQNQMTHYDTMNY